MDLGAPIIGLTANLKGGRFTLRSEYERAVRLAGGVPLVLCPPTDPRAELAPVIEKHLRVCDAIVFSGGDDPDTSPFGEPAHPEANLIDPARQRYEVALLCALERVPETPVLGICLGMQLMALVRGGHLDQHMPATIETHKHHADDRAHEIHPAIDGLSVLWADRQAARETLGEAVSWHRQRIVDAGELRVVARAHDGVIEAIDDPDRPFYLGVQWHPERTSDPALGPAIFEALVDQARAPTPGPALR